MKNLKKDIKKNNIYRKLSFYFATVTNLSIVMLLVITAINIKPLIRMCKNMGDITLYVSSVILAVIIITLVMPWFFFEELADKRLIKIESSYKLLKPKQLIITEFFPNAIFLKGPSVIIIILENKTVKAYQIDDKELTEIFEIPK